MKCALVIENDEATAQAVMSELNGHGFTVQWASNGSTGLALAVSGEHDTITLARLLPDLDGLTIVDTLREQGIDTPILMLSAPADIDARVENLRAEGDDYLTKPFTSGEMVARLEMLQRRQHRRAHPTPLVSGSLQLDQASHSVTRAGEPLQLLPSEFKLLAFLLRNIGQRVTPTLLFEQVWGYPFDPGNQIIEVHIERLRKKLDGPGTPQIQSLRDGGYRLLDATCLNG
jgi:two-component system OmpR family response regulator